MDTNNFTVEGRHFPNSLHAFTFAQIHADRMDRAVEVHIREYLIGSYWRAGAVPARRDSSWHATAQPSHFKRRHLVATYHSEPQ